MPFTCAPGVSGPIPGTGGCLGPAQPDGNGSPGTIVVRPTAPSGVPVPRFMADALHSQDIRALFQLVGELRELGADPAAWRRHLVTALASLCGASLAVVSELRVDPAVAATTNNCAEVVRP